MMVMCPHCFEIFPELWVVPCHKCGTKTFATDLSIVNIVKRLIELGFRIAYSCCYTDDNEDGIGKTTQIKIEFSEKYPSALFPELPPEWSIRVMILTHKENILAYSVSANIRPASATTMLLILIRW